MSVTLFLGMMVKVEVLRKMTDEVRRQRSAWYSFEKVLVPAQVPPD